MAMDQVPDVLRIIGMEMLTSDPSSYKEAVKLLKQLFTWQTKHVRSRVIGGMECLMQPTLFLPFIGRQGGEEWKENGWAMPD